MASTNQMILIESTEADEEPSLGTFRWSALHVHMMVVDMQVYNSDDVPRVTGSLTHPTLFGCCVVIVPHWECHLVVPHKTWQLAMHGDDVV